MPRRVLTGSYWDWVILIELEFPADEFDVGHFKGPARDLFISPENCPKCTTDDLSRIDITRSLHKPVMIGRFRYINKEAED